MATYFIEEDLKLIRHSKNEFRSSCDGVLKSEKRNYFYISNIHGSQCGTLAMQYADKMIPLTPANIRLVVFEKMGIHISETEKVVISPCYPKKVISRNEKELEENNIKVLLPDTKIPVKINFILNGFRARVYAQTVASLQDSITVIGAAQAKVLYEVVNKIVYK